MENMYTCNMQSYFLYVMQLQKLNSLEFRKVGCLPRVLDLLFQARFWFMVYYGSLNQVILFLHIVQFPFMHLLFAFQILKSPFIFTKSTIFFSIQISSLIRCVFYINTTTIFAVEWLLKWCVNSEQILLVIHHQYQLSFLHVDQCSIFCYNCST